jgi:soluble P-type ATPase
VLIKGSRYLELLGSIQAISFDKSGTLTQGHFQLKHMEQYNQDITRQQLLRYIAALEQHSNHPLAPAIIGYAAGQGCVGGVWAEDVQVVAGKGVVGNLEGRRVAVGSWTFCQELLRQQQGGEGQKASAAKAAAPAGAEDTDACEASPARGAAAAKAAVAAAEQLIQQWAARGASVVAVLVDSQLAGLLLLSDSLRKDAWEAVVQLQQQGCHCCMLSGDSMAAAMNIGTQLGMEVEDVYAELMPQDKLEMISLLRQRHKVVGHVGDGINDAPALAAADVGVAMGVAGSALAVDAADVALFTNDIRTLAFAVRLGHRVSCVVIGNIAFACAIKLVVLIVAAAGHASLWLSLLADVGASLIVTLHALTLLRFEADWGGGGDGSVAGSSGGVFGWFWSMVAGVAGPVVGKAYVRWDDSTTNGSSREGSPVTGAHGWGSLANYQRRAAAGGGQLLRLVGWERWSGRVLQLLPGLGYRQVKCRAVEIGWGMDQLSRVHSEDVQDLLEQGQRGEHSSSADGVAAAGGAAEEPVPRGGGEACTGVKLKAMKVDGLSKVKCGVRSPCLPVSVCTPKFSLEEDEDS